MTDTANYITDTGPGTGKRLPPARSCCTLTRQHFP